MSEKRFVCIDVGYGDDWYITDNGKKLSEMEIVDLLNELNDGDKQLRQVLSENEKLLQKDLDMLTELRRENEQLKNRLNKEYIKECSL